MRRIGLRARISLVLCAFVTVVYVVLSQVVFSVAERQLELDFEDAAEMLLADYLGGLSSGGFGSTDIGSAQATRFFFLDAGGREITESDYLTEVSSGPSLGVPASELDGSGSGNRRPQVVELGEVPPGALVTDLDLVIQVEVDEPAVMDRGDEVIAVGQTLQTGEGTTFTIGVSTPRRPLDSSLQTLRRQRWIFLPFLIAATAAAVWFSTNRSLRTVADLAAQADAISAANLDQRVDSTDPTPELAHLASTLNSMLTRIDGAQRQQQQFISDAAHELRSPVAATLTQVEVALAHPEASDWAGTATRVIKEQESLSGLIDDLLTLAELQEDHSISVTEIDAADLVRTEADRQPSNITLEAPAALAIHANHRLIGRAVRNLLDNATRHADTTITVTLRAEGPDILIVVEDDGAGVPAEARSTIFDRFSRLDHARDRRSGGTGLGLAIAEEVCRLHHGSIRCDESPTFGGARFTVTLPKGSPES